MYRPPMCGLRKLRDVYLIVGRVHSGVVFMATEQMDSQLTVLPGNGKCLRSLVGCFGSGKTTTARIWWQVEKCR
jgi:ABC-type glutathione transport system ATPase component